MAGIERGDIDVVQIYDHFGPFVLFALEDYGFVADAGGLVEEGGTAFDSERLPVNTSGGHLSEAYMQGMNHLIEATRQVRGRVDGAGCRRRVFVLRHGNRHGRSHPGAGRTMSDAPWRFERPVASTTAKRSGSARARARKPCRTFS